VKNQIQLNLKVTALPSLMIPARFRRVERLHAFVWFSLGRGGCEAYCSGFHPRNLQLLVERAVG
jgi:hypothetical protein